MSTALPAQEIRGLLLRGDSVTPAAGAIVEVRRVSRNEVIARTITDASGRFAIRTPAEAVALRALRLGWRPEGIGTFALAAGESRDVRVVLTDTPIELAPVLSSADARCRQYGQASPLVATLFSELHTALLASQLYSPTGVPRSRFRYSIIDVSPDGHRLLDEKHREYVSDSLRPFRTHTPEALLRDGFVSYDREGTATYRAPDAEFLTSDGFLESHCLRYVTGDSAHPLQFGIGFEPARQVRSKVQVRGIMWASGNPVTLERIEFSYVGLDQVSESGNPGGWLEYTELDDGLWFANRWELRIPKLGAALVVRRRDMRSAELRELQEVRILQGEVLEVSVDGRISFSVGDADFIDGDGRVSVRADSGSLGACAATTVQAAVHGIVRDTAGRALQGAQVSLAWRSAGASGADADRSTSTSDGSFALCGAPADRWLRLQIEATGYEPAALVLRAPARGGRIHLDIRLLPSGGSE